MQHLASGHYKSSRTAFTIKMKNLAISAILAFAAHAITLSEVTESDKKMMIPGEEVE